MTHGPLTKNDACALADIIRAAQGNKRVARLIPGTDTVVYGTARSIGDERGNFAGNNDEIRDLYLWVTTADGWDVFWPIAELIKEQHSDTFLADYLLY